MLQHVPCGKQYMRLSPGGLLGKESTSCCSSSGDSAKHGLFMECQVSVTPGESWAAGALPPCVSTGMVTLACAAATDCMCKSCPAQDFIADWFLQWGTGCCGFWGSCLFCSMGAFLVTSQT